MKAKRNPSRVTISLDEGTAILLEDLKKELNAPRSDVIRRSLHFYSENKQIMRRASKIRSYLELLSSGEHVILDIDHWQLFLNFVEASREKNEFWEGHKKVAKSHGEQFRDTSLKDILERLEACNFYNLREVGSGEFVLIMNSELAKKFVKTFLEEIFSVTGYKVEVREELAKLRVKAL